MDICDQLYLTDDIGSNKTIYILHLQQHDGKRLFWIWEDMHITLFLSTLLTMPAYCNSIMHH